MQQQEKEQPLNQVEILYKFSTSNNILIKNSQHEEEILKDQSREKLKKIDNKNDDNLIQQNVKSILQKKSQVTEEEEELEKKSLFLLSIKSTFEKLRKRKKFATNFIQKGFFNNKNNNNLTTTTPTINCKKEVKIEEEDNNNKKIKSRRRTTRTRSTTMFTISMPAMPSLIIKYFIILQFIITITTTMHLNTINLYCQCSSVSVNGNNDNQQLQQQQQQQQNNNAAIINYYYADYANNNNNNNNNNNININNNHKRNQEEEEENVYDEKNALKSENATNTTTTTTQTTTTIIPTTTLTNRRIMNNISENLTQLNIDDLINNYKLQQTRQQQQQQHHLIDEQQIKNLINRQNIFFNKNDDVVGEQQQQQQYQQSLSSSSTSTLSCQSCLKMREKAKIDNLETIKSHILARLNLTMQQLPKIMVRDVPNKIVERFFRNFKNAKQQQQQQKQQQQQQKINNHKRNKHESINDDDTDVDDDDIDEADNDDDALSGMQRDQAQVDIEQLHGFEFDHSPLHNDDSFDEQFNYNDNDDDDYNNDYDFDENSFYSNVKSIYIFPKEMARMRHNRKSTDIIGFPTGGELHNKNIRAAILHLYIRGHAWAHQQHQHQQQKSKIISHQQQQQHYMQHNLDIIVYRSTTATKTFKDHQNYQNSTSTNLLKISELKNVPLPKNEGKWIEIDLTDFLRKYLKEQQQQQEENTYETNFELPLIVKGAHTWMRPFIVTSVGKNKPLSMHLEIITKPKRYRHKRSTSLDCQETDNEVRCCRYPLTVNFTSFGWHFVVAPTSFDAYFCNGECKVGYLEQYAHTHIASLTTSATPCCSPTKMSPLNLIYFNMEQQLVFSTIPNMSVDKCRCS